MEDKAVDAFLTSSFGTFVMTLWRGILSTPSWHNFTYLAYGWALACGRQTITNYLLGSGAAQVKHFSRYYAFLSGALFHRRYQLWARVIRCGASLVPADAVNEGSPQQAAGYQEENLIMMRNHGFSNSSL